MPAERNPFMAGATRAGHSPRVTIYETDRAAAVALARRVADAVSRKPDLVLGLPTGRTPIPFYDELARLASSGGADFSRVTTFNLDEFLGVRPSDPGSYRSFMERHLFSHVDIQAHRIHFLDGSAADPAGECDRYEHAIEAAGGIDLQVLGIGTNGHIGFNEPAPELEARTHRVTLKPETRRSNAALFGGDEARVPREALSMGVGTILRSRAIVLLANGAAKASCVERVVHGGVTTQLPASFLQLHHDVDLMVDEGAAEKLRR